VEAIETNGAFPVPTPPNNVFWLGSSFSQIEPAMAFQYGLPLLLIIQSGVIMERKEPHLRGSRLREDMVVGNSHKDDPVLPAVCCLQSPARTGFRGFSKFMFKALLCS